MAISAVSSFFHLSFFFFLFSSFLAVSQGAGFSVDLTHRDSALSPFQRISRAIQRSNSRLDYFRKTFGFSSDNVQSKVLSDNGEYLMSLSIGTPPVRMNAIADTGSDLTWIQCNPCEDCYQQDDPLFDPSNTSTYRNVSCESSTCQTLPESTCDGNDSGCSYSYSYGDQSFSNGALAAETLTLDSSERSPVRFKKFIFGCGHNNKGTFHSSADGIVGLGGGPLSLISQLGSSIDGKFSYCLVPFSDNSSSVLSFGDDAIVSGKRALSTPLVPKRPDTFYFLTLEKISVGNRSFEFPTPLEGNIIIDSGTTLTYLEEGLFGDLKTELSNLINVPPTEDPEGVLQLCYEISKVTDLPDLVFGFDGADVVLTSLNTYIQVSDELGCFAFLPTTDVMIFGNVAQVNFKVGYDAAGKKVSFVPSKCSTISESIGFLRN